MSIELKGDVLKVRGLVRWASVPPASPRKPHEDAFNPAEPDNCFYSIEVECSDLELSKILALIGKKPGQPFTPQLREYLEDVINQSTGEVMASKTDKKFLKVKKTKIKGEYVFDDIPVKNRDGSDLVDVAIGNDSEAIVHISVEPVKKGSPKKTLRLKGVQVVNLVPFALSGGSNSIELDSFEDDLNNLNEQQNQQALQAADNEDLDDDIPF